MNMRRTNDLSCKRAGPRQPPIAVPELQEPLDGRFLALLQARAVKYAIRGDQPLAPQERELTNLDVALDKLLWRPSMNHLHVPAKGVERLGDGLSVLWMGATGNDGMKVTDAFPLSRRHNAMTLVVAALAFVHEYIFQRPKHLRNTRHPPAIG